MIWLYWSPEQGCASLNTVKLLIACLKLMLKNLAKLSLNVDPGVYSAPGEPGTWGGTEEVQGVGSPSLVCQNNHISGPWSHGEPLPEMQGHTESCVLGLVLHPCVQCWHWAGSSGIKLLFFKSSWVSILVAVSQEMTTMDPFIATPPFIKSSESRGKPRIPEAGFHCSVPSKLRCTLHVCLKWKHELVLASKAAASKFSLECKCSSQQTVLLAENKGERQAPARRCCRAVARSAAGYLQINWLYPTISVRGLKHLAIRKYLGNFFFPL